jgi:hypothetical protein
MNKDGNINTHFLQTKERHLHCEFICIQNILFLFEVVAKLFLLIGLYIFFRRLQILLNLTPFWYCIKTEIKLVVAFIF